MNLPSDGLNPYNNAPVSERLGFLKDLTKRKDTRLTAEEAVEVNRVIVGVIASSSINPDVMGAALSQPSEYGETMRVGQLYPVLPLAYLALNTEFGFYTRRQIDGVHRMIDDLFPR